MDVTTPNGMMVVMKNLRRFFEKSDYRVKTKQSVYRTFLLILQHSCECFFYMLSYMINIVNKSAKKLLFMIWHDSVRLCSIKLAQFWNLPAKNRIFSCVQIGSAFFL